MSATADLTSRHSRKLSRLPTMKPQPERRASPYPFASPADWHTLLARTSPHLWPRGEPEGIDHGLVAEHQERQMTTPPLIYDDLRPIREIWGEVACYCVDATVRDRDVTRIVAYKEHGLSDFVPWLAVYSGEEIIARVPAQMVAIRYATPLERT